jgi:hypothetical protein
MKAVWTQDLRDQKARDDRAQAIKNSTVLINRLLTILSDKFDMIEKLGFKEDDYINAQNLHELQAFRNGKLATYKEIADLFDFKQEG